MYGPLFFDLELADFSVSLVTIEVGCLGHFLPSSVSDLCKVCHLQKNCVHTIFRQASEVAISRFLMPAPPNCGMLLTFYPVVR